MKLIIPFTYMDNWHYQRYRDQFKAYCQNFDKVTVSVQFGVYPENDLKNLEFMIYNEVKGKRKITLFQKFKNIVKKITFMDWVRKIELQNKLVKYFIKEGVDGDAVLGYSGTGLNQIGHCELSDKLGVPAIYRMRGNGVKERKIYAKPPNRFISNQFHYRSLERYAAFIPICHKYALELMKWGVAASKLLAPVGLGVDTNLFKPSEKPNKLTIGYFGRISKEKNLKLLEKVARFENKIKFILVGKGGNKYKFPSNVHYVGYIQKGDMPKYFNMVNCIFHPSLSEGESNIILEAYATGTPVLGTRQAFSDLPIFGYPISHDDWRRVICVLHNLSLENLMDIGQCAREFALDKSWFRFGSYMSQAIKGVIEK